MKLSTKGRYAVTAMLDLALHENRGPVILADISQGQGISLSYLEQLFARLRRARLVTGVRGPGGGYRLARPAQVITVADVIVAVDDNGDALGGYEGKLNGAHCLTHDLWSELSAQIYDFLNGITLADLASESSIRVLARTETAQRTSDVLFDPQEC
ncbi:Rrf2 family transcriptional regulator [Nitrococcus mobilis]|uniref:Iron-sulfur cluster assembly transcription factor IscR n=1 Tax=Nitrococcus mobilis Nb-231 TaxID=314278 RepID=A4BUX3_9GAMM|nr:Rrf2 family transcriptional regulator [Nitrococcus mobilis]EAR20487.1 iron-sulfur cluster assembly transcription factor IscR [Nitrococcus mobilis Nb-231]